MVKTGAALRFSRRGNTLPGEVLAMILRRLALRTLLTILIVVSVFPVVAVPVSAGSIWLNVSSGTVGSSVQVSGDSFNTTDTGYTVYFDNAIVQSGSVIAGTLTATTFTVPPATGGPHNIKVLTGLAEEITLQFTINPRLNLVGGGSGKVGESVSVSGDGFRASAAVAINFDTTVAASAAASANGVLNTTQVSVPETPWGAHQITATDGTATTPPVSFSVVPNITLSPVSGSVGDTVSLSGSGFAAASQITLLFDSMQQGSTLATALGSFSGATFTVPNAASGNHTVSAQDASAHAAQAIYAVGQQASVSPATGTVGTSVSVSGNGFGAGVPLSIKFAGEPVTTVPAGLTTRSDGTFSGTFAVPAASGGTFLVEISDGTYSMTSSFQVIAKVTASVSGGSVGDNVTLSGMGFITGATVSVTFDVVQVAIGSVAADGSFSVSFKAPPAIGGDHIMAATDGQNTLTSVFTMESTAPEIPAPVSPLDGEKGTATGSFIWQPVNDPSGVTYTLQISHDGDFATTLLTRPGLADPSYTVLASEALAKSSKDAPYYWRVRAVDGASNAGDWSAPQSFKVGTVLQMRNWVLYLIGGVIAVVAFLAGFLLGRKVAYF
jgi:hypothetical protein